MATYRHAELRDTVSLMDSIDYKERFKAEYMQVCIRYQKLKAMLDKWDTGELGFTPSCPRGVYNFQIRAMADYIASLEARAAIEDIEL
ncbi:crAss001_48 related protein [Ruminococcus callidus]|uniref:crAss001_48 related protein n=1 Tax=Ruminococcus callidus TaxID=40519 RepID=UPI003FD7AD50